MTSSSIFVAAEATGAHRPTMLELIQAADFSKTGLGPRERWPQSLRTALSICLSSRFPMIIFWGPDLCVLYNDAYVPIFARKHPGVLGKTAFEAWGEVWDVIDPMFRSVMERGEATWSSDQLLVLERKGFTEETYLTWSYSPISDETGGVGGVFTAVFETTERVLGERRLVTLRELGAQVANAKSTPAAAASAVATLGKNSHDVPFALLYLLEADGNGARLTAQSGIEPGEAASPLTLAIDDPAGWPVAEAIRTGQMQVIEDAEVRFGKLPGGAWPDSARAAVVLPIASTDLKRPQGVLILGTSPRLEIDRAYQDFFKLVGNHVASALASAHAYEEERRRAEALAEIDRAKTAFFSNVSHEFRTPLTLLLGPLEDAIAVPGASLGGASLEVAHRNALRLLKLVNALLDFSRIEAGRAQAAYRPVELARFTRELASSFESAMLRGGLTFTVDCAEPGEPVYVDPDMWERIVLNLLSNAFKFTFEGAVNLSLRKEGDFVVLRVSDTGTGVPTAELPRLFERFHRVEGAKSRTHEGSGIGLALIHELVKMHGGTISAESALGKGSSFAVSIPLGFAHLPPERIRAEETKASTAMRTAFVEEAQRWLLDVPQLDAERVAEQESSRADDSRILVADDNADMREYITRLLRGQWNVEAVADGAAALASALRNPPSLIISDLMMPGLDGFQLLKKLREDPRTNAIPVIFLSARAGEEARVEGMESGADDYLVKPFAARELLARVKSHLELARLRADDATVHRISSLLSAELDQQRLLQLLTDETTRLIGAQFGAYFCNVVDAKGESYMLYTLSGAPREAFATFPMPRNTAIFAPMFAGRGILRLDDVTKDERYGKSGPSQGMPAGHLPVRSYLAAPVVSASGRVHGGLFFGHGRPGVFTERSERLLAGVAAQASIAVDNAHLYEDSRKQQEKVRDLLVREQSARNQAESATRAKDEFLAILGHELRNPLAPILTALQLMRLRGDQSSLREREVIERQVSHVVRLVDDLLDVSRITRGKIELGKEVVELAETVAKAIEMVSPLLEQKGHRLTVSIPRSGLAVVGDPMRLAQVMSNLLSNAAKYTEANGEIAVAGGVEDGRAVLRVSDSGVGIDPQMIGAVFEPFVQERQSLERSQGGLGLGLTIVRTLVELHGGSVEARSEGKGRGSEFIVRFPLGKAQMEATPNRRSNGSPARPTGRRVLVVDDNVDAADMLAASLSQLGYTAEVAYDGPAALRSAATMKPDVVILDIGLPVMDGYEVAERLLANPDLAKVRLVALTGYGQPADREKSKAAGFHEHLVKPIELERVLALVDRLAPRDRA